MDRPQNHWFYQRIKVNAPTYLVFFELAGGLGFLLRRYHLIQPDYFKNPISGVITPYPSVNVELTDGTGAIQWQKNAIPSELYSAQRRSDVVIKTETAPADKSGFGVNMSAVFKPRAQTVNLFYDIGEQIYCRLSNLSYNQTLAQWTPDYIDFAIEGVYIP